MAYSVIQTGDALALLSAEGVQTPLTLPDGVTLRTDVLPRWAVFKRYVVLVNTPSQPLIIDSDGVVRLMTPKPPRLGASLSGVSGGTLSGTFRVFYTFVTFDDDGNVISESGFSPESNVATIATQDLKAANLDLSPDAISGRRLYRTTDNGGVYFQWLDVSGNVATQVQDDLPDASLELLAAPTLGTPPTLTHIGTWRGRLWGVGAEDIDKLRYTEAGLRYAWPEDNNLIIPVEGEDARGITALLARRDSLGVGRLNLLAHVVGSAVEDAAGVLDVQVVILAHEVGVESQESVAVHRDIAYFLWKDGVYSWGPEGIRCVSDGIGGRGQVRSWFATDDYFNRDRFQYAFAHVDPDRHKYRLFLASAGSVVEDTWVEYDIVDRTWWGPHTTGAFTPRSAFYAPTAQGRSLAVVGGEEGHVFREQVTRTDSTSTAIAMRVLGKRHAGSEPDLEKHFGQMTVLGRGQSTGHVRVSSRIGELNATRARVHQYDLSRSRHKLGHGGNGKHLELELEHATAGQKVELYGYEIDPVHLTGQR